MNIIVVCADTLRRDHISAYAEQSTESASHCGAESNGVAVNSAVKEVSDRVIDRQVLKPVTPHSSEDRALVS